MLSLNSGDNVLGISNAVWLLSIPSCDILAIRSGSFARRLSGDLGSFYLRSMTAKDNDTLIVIEFTSDGSVTKRGFKANYRISPAPKMLTATISTTTSPTTSPPILGKINYLLIRSGSTSGRYGLSFTRGKTTALHVISKSLGHVIHSDDSQSDHQFSHFKIRVWDKNSTLTRLGQCYV